ncbi:uncharacterized protein JN550_007624 [Neoarthrinium moseri]|uniref:uncharacterized protein n=1 Tax=Neoarthrinium moseri TaxID=1658444 RepID=UPI001FDCFA73|nr:uncharacterized protein JN550_007624 [Neoarthrinium moseri]KAI1866236.1 hypothetical protein JN550_007624 [Neoarthrinium moseri]
MSRRQPSTKLSTNKDTPHDDDAAKLFDGIHSGAWVYRFPPSWVPYIQLARLSPPVPVLLIYFPHVFGIAHAAATQKAPLGDVIRVCLLLLGGSFFLSNAIHRWNDLIDAPIDRQIPRTRNRPVARGAISPQGAMIFTISQAFGAALFLLFLPSDTVLCTLPSIVANTYYPFAKRHTHFPQVVLGVALQWAVIVGSCAMGGGSPRANTSVLYLFLGSLLWTVIYDTIYGFQDYADDIKIGVKSTAVLFGEWGKPILWLMSNCMAGLLLASGQAAEMSLIYLVIAVGGTFGCLNWMMASVNLKSPDSCAWWFTYGFWGPAVSISLGLLCEYIFA